MSQDMMKKNSQRLTAMERSQSAMERTQAETNRRLGDVMKCNLDLQSMLKSFMSSMSGTNAGEEVSFPRTGSTKMGDMANSGQKRCSPPPGTTSGIGSSERWWDNLCKSSDEDDILGERKRKREVTDVGTEHMVDLENKEQVSVCSSSNLKVLCI